jgi:TonB family protein
VLTSSVAVVLGRATALFAAAFVLLWFTRRSSPAVRHLICLCGLAGSLAVLLTVFIAASTVTLHIPVSSQSLISSGGELAGWAWYKWTWSKSAATIWMCGCALVVFRCLIGYASLARALSTAIPFIPSGRLSGWARETASNIPMLAADVGVPLVTGLFRPVILMPRRAKDWPESQRTAAVRHELAHRERGDLWANFAAALVCAIYWFHPLAWALARRMHAEQEAACDDFVLQSGFDRASYAEALVETARGLTSGYVFPGCSMADQMDVKTRVVRVLSSAPAQSAPLVKRRTSRAVIAASMLVLIGVSSISAERVYRVGRTVTVPVVIHKIDPEYTAKARTAKIQGQVLLKLVIDPDGVGRDIVVIRGIDSGLNQNAVRAVRRWRFQPATHNATPVAVSANIEVTFRLL